VPAKKRFTEIDAEVRIMPWQVNGLLEKFIVGKLTNESSPADVDGKMIEIVANVVRVFFNERA
jgi:hypothetical protein